MKRTLGAGKPPYEVEADGRAQRLLLLRREATQSHPPLRTGRERRACIARIARTADGIDRLWRVGNAGITGRALTREGAAELLLNDAPGLEERNVVHGFILDEAADERGGQNSPFEERGKLLLSQEHAILRQALLHLNQRQRPILLLVKGGEQF